MPNPRRGFKRSRAIWDEARMCRDSKMEEAKYWLRAILYELQPIRLSQIDTHGIQSLIRSARQGLWHCIRQLPVGCRWLYAFLWKRSPKEWMIVAAIVGYYYLVRWIHE